MFYLSDGKPKFYIGKINGIGYTTQKEKEMLIKQLKEENPDIEVKNEKEEIDEELRQKAIELGQLQLTYSKSEFMKYLNSEKPIPGLEVERLREENELLQLAIMEMALANEERTEEAELAIAELTNLIGEVL